MCLAIPGQIEELYQQDGMSMARVNFGGIKRAVCVQCVDVAAGQYVLVHVGFAISVIDEEEAQRTLELIRQSGDIPEFADN